MLEIKDGKKILTTPISDEDLKDILIGDIIYLNGIVSYIYRQWSVFFYQTAVSYVTAGC